MPHTVLSLDLGSKVGWCIAQDNKIRASGTKNLKRPAVGGKEPHAGDRYLQFMNWLPKWKNVDEIFFERVPRFESLGAAQVYCGLRAILMVYGQTTGKPILSMVAPKVKKIFTGKGNSDKLAVCRAAHAMGWNGGEKGTSIDNDEADACAVYYAIMQARGIDVTFCYEDTPPADQSSPSSGLITPDKGITLP